MLNWAPICDISVVPVVNDADARKAMQDKPWFNKEESQQDEVHSENIKLTVSKEKNKEDNITKANAGCKCNIS